MWVMKLTATNEQTRKPNKTHRHRQQYNGYQREGGLGVVSGKGDQYMVTGDLTSGGKHMMQSISR